MDARNDEKRKEKIGTWLYPPFIRSLPKSSLYFPAPKLAMFNSLTRSLHLLYSAHFVHYSQC